MTLEPLAKDDLTFMSELESNPVVMKELGGPLPPEAMRAKLEKRAALLAAGKAVIWKILDEGRPAGIVCLWDSEHDGETMSEVGWMLKPEFHGRGLATKAARALIEHARRDPRWGALHAFTGVANAPSNAICRKLGFTLVGERKLEYSGRLLRSNHWRLDA